MFPTLCGDAKDPNKDLNKDLGVFMVKSNRNLQELPQFSDGLSYVYIEHAHVDQDAQAITWVSEQGVLSMPAASLAVIYLGPGTRITHAAVKTCAQAGCLVVWVGEENQRFYASGTGETRFSRGLHKQVRLWSDAVWHLKVVQRMYNMRFGNTLSEQLTLQQIRGKEGARIRDIYAYWSKETGVPWNGRSYKNTSWQDADPINRAISSGNTYLYGLAHSAIVTCGYSPALGFIHVGKQLSFVYDLADIYKTESVIPYAFQVIAESDTDVEKRLRKVLREYVSKTKLLERMMNDLNTLFSLTAEEEAELFCENTGDWWGGENIVIDGGTTWL